jgi:hypothetical protein
MLIGFLSGVGDAGRIQDPIAVQRAGGSVGGWTLAEAGKMPTYAIAKARR